MMKAMSVTLYTVCVVEAPLDATVFRGSKITSDYFLLYGSRAVMGHFHMIRQNNDKKHTKKNDKNTCSIQHLQ